MNPGELETVTFRHVPLNAITMNGVLGHDSALLRLYWTEDNLKTLSHSYNYKLITISHNYYFVTNIHTTDHRASPHL